jgi:hypothetical protein
LINEENASLNSKRAISMGYKNENEQINVQKIKEDTHINPSDLFF